MKNSFLLQRILGVFGLFLMASFAIGYGVKYALAINSSFEFMIISLGIFILLILIHDYLERALYQNQITAAITQFRLSHELIIEHITKESLPPSSTHSENPLKNDILAEIQILGNLIEKVLHPETGTTPLESGEVSSEKDLSSVSTVPEETAYSHHLLAQVKQALQDDRIEMLLQPIVSLPQRKPRYFECYSRIRTKDNIILNPEDFISIAEDNSLIQIIDNMILFRCIQLIRKTLRKNFNIRFFVNLSRLTLASDFFRENFIDFIRENAPIAPNLIFELEYSTLAEAENTTIQSLRELHNYGCRFSVDQLPSINIDFKKLIYIKAKFVKIDAVIFQQMLLQEPSGQSLHKFKAELDKAGCDLIITKVEDEQTLVELLDFNLDFGQGFLFGAPQLAPVHG